MGLEATRNPDAVDVNRLREIAEKRRRKQAKKSRQGEGKRGENVRRQSETWMRDIGMQIGDTGRAW